MYQDDEFEDDRPSKSQIKREMHELQALGERLVKLNEEATAKVPISDRLATALTEMRRLSKREARRRQLQYIGKLMRTEDGPAIEQALERLEAGGVAQTRLLHESENWRDRMIADGDAALSGFLSAHPEADRQQLRQLIRTAQKERDHNKPPAASRKLFRYVRGVIDTEAE